VTIKARLLLIVVGGIFLLFGASFYSNQQLKEANAGYNADASLTSYTSAWFGSLDGSYVNNLEVYDPTDGSFANIDYWDFEKDPYTGEDTNPLHAAFRIGNAQSVSNFLDEVFLDAIDNETITFVTAYGVNGQRYYCNSSLYLVGVDPCSEDASPDYMDEFDELISAVGRGSTRRISLIADASGELPVSVNDTMVFGLAMPADDASGESQDASGESQTVGVIILGANIVDGLEMFAENFEVETAIALQDDVITVYDYYEEELPEGLGGLIESDLSASRDEGYTYSTIVPELKHRVTSIPFSRETRASEVRLLIFDNQTELIEALDQSSFQNQLSFALVGGAILLVVFFITTVSFNRINSSILALEKIERGELEKTDENNYKLFTSDNDEVSRLQRSIEEYREHRIEAEDQRQERARRRDERDSIMFEKMSVLSQQLEGNARDMLVQEIMDMRDKLSSGNDEDKEQASIEMMSRAFSKMSEEVSTLIDARTQELVVARDEISSSIRYAAKLQKTLLPKSFPGDIDIEVEWRPRDLVGGDIYFIKDFPDKVYIAVVDCTGHGVPGAFLSIIARSHLDKAIREDGDQTAGEYLSEVNALLRATLSRADQSNTSEEGFDGGVCIYRREYRSLEFAGAKASLFNVDGQEASEVGGDRKSVGSSRIPDGFQYSTHYVSSPSGAFVMLTDGITDVMSPDERPVAFGRRRVLRILRDSKNATPSNIVKEIISSVDLYRGNAPLRDDLTLLAFSLEDPTPATENIAISGESKG